MATLQLFLLVFSLVVEAGCPTPAKLVTCKASASALGDPANVTCSFNKVLDDPNMEIMVVHHPLGATNTHLGKDVLVCFRSGNANIPNCITRDGYRFNDSISDRLTLEIPVATPECEGEYACHIIPPDGFVVHSCNLSVPDNADSPQDTTASVNGPNYEGGSSCADGYQVTIIVLTTVLIGVTMLLIIENIVIVRRRHCERNRTGKSQQEDAEGDPQSTEPFITSINSQRQPSFISNTWRNFVGLLRVQGTTDDTKNTDYKSIRSIRILTTSDADLRKKNQSVRGNILERNALLEDKAKASQMEQTVIKRTQGEVCTTNTELVAQSEESRKDR